MRRARWLDALAFAVLIPAMFGGCYRTETRSPTDLDFKLDNTSYVEEGDLLALIVSTRVAFVRDHENYMPLEVAVANKGMPSLSLTAESFTLTDQDGRSYPAVSGAELRRAINVDVDRRLGTLAPVVRSRYGNYAFQPGTFTTSFDYPIQRDVNLPRFSWTIDLIYFPKPAGGVRGRSFELFMNAPELDDPVFVRFAVGGSAEDER